MAKATLRIIVPIALVAVLAYFLATRLGYDFPQAPSLQTSPEDSAPPVADSARRASPGVYFSGVDRLGDEIIFAINHTTETLDVAVYELNHPGIASAIRAAQQRGVRARIITDSRKQEQRNSQIPGLRAAGVPIRISEGHTGSRSRMHAKFGIFDHKLVAVGSFNWSVGGDLRNFEAGVFVADPELVSQFEAGFERIWSQAR